MTRTLPAEDLREEYTDAVQSVEAADALTHVQGAPNVQQQVLLQGYSLTETVELGRSLDVGAVYTDRVDDDGSLEWVGVHFFSQGVLHTQTVESEAYVRARVDQADDRDDEIERKRELAEELLTQYDDVLDRAQEWRLEHAVDDMRMDRLFQLQDRLQRERDQKEREERINEDLERELAEQVYQDDQFGRQFNETDTEMLLGEMDVEFDPERVRFGEVHKRAKSLLKVTE